MADLVWENTTAAEATVLGQLVTGYPLGWVLAMAAALGFVIALLLVASVGRPRGAGSVAASSAGCGVIDASIEASPEAQHTSALDQWFGRDGP